MNPFDDNLHPAPEDRVSFDGEWAYKYDDAGYVISKISEREIRTYGYDQFHELVEAKRRPVNRDDPEGPEETTACIYDANGDRRLPVTHKE